MFRFLTAGESHGKALLAIVEGLPSGMFISKDFIDKELSRRQLGYGRGGRMQIEKDEVEILSGVRFGKTLGSPIALLIRNLDWENWKEIMAIGPVKEKVSSLTEPRPGHADLAGTLKTGQDDIRNILERASARETAARVSVGAIAKVLLLELGIKVISHTISIGKVAAELKEIPEPHDLEKIDSSPVRCFDDEASELMVKEIEKAIQDKDSLGGVFEVIAFGVPPGLGDYISWDRRFDTAVAKAFMSIPAVKGVEIGIGFALAKERGSRVHDEIFYSPEKGFFHKTNRAGGIEGGVTNGEPIVVRAAMKPIPTLGLPLKTVNIKTKEPADAFKERADICALPSAAVIGETMLALELAGAILEKFGGDSLVELKRNYEAYLKGLKSL